MKCKSLKKIAPKGFSKSEMYSAIGLSDDSDNEDSSTGTLESDDEITTTKCVPALLVPIRRKKVPTVILEEETDFK
jgi:hypothetical protein